MSNAAGHAAEPRFHGGILLAAAAAMVLNILFHGAGASQDAIAEAMRAAYRDDAA